MNKFDAYRTKTFTPLWNNFSQKPKKFQLSSIFFKKVKRKLKELIRFQIKIQKFNKSNSDYEMFNSYQVNSDVLNYRNLMLSKSVENFVAHFKLKCSKNKIFQYVEEYCNSFINTPIRDLNSGFGFNEGLFLFCLIKIIKPTLIIESGIMKGFTTYLIDAASDKNCLIKCFDINIENIEYKSKKAEYNNFDITASPPDIKNHKVLAFWDDHTSQLDRLEFSLKNNIKFNIFDDDLGFLNFHSDGWPPIPSITMLYEIKNNLVKPQNIKWVSRGKLGEMWLKSLKINTSVDKIKFYKKFPSMFSFTGYKSHSECSFLILK